MSKSVRRNGMSSQSIEKVNDSIKNILIKKSPIAMITLRTMKPTALITKLMSSVDKKDSI